MFKEEIGKKCNQQTTKEKMLKANVSCICHKHKEETVLFYCFSVFQKNKEEIISTYFE